jgi:hypothetical protein
MQAVCTRRKCSVERAFFLPGLVESDGRTRSERQRDTGQLGRSHNTVSKYLSSEVYTDPDISELVDKIREKELKNLYLSGAKVRQRVHGANRDVSSSGNCFSRVERGDQHGFAVELGTKPEHFFSEKRARTGNRQRLQR